MGIVISSQRDEDDRDDDDPELELAGTTTGCMSLTVSEIHHVASTNVNLNTSISI